MALSLASHAPSYEDTCAHFVPSSPAAAMTKTHRTALPHGGRWMVNSRSSGLIRPLAVFAVLFATIYTMLPDEPLLGALMVLLL
jgi:hypothetical protein